MSGHLLPFLWLHGESDDELRKGILEIRDAGCTTLCAESRTHPDYLGPSWWREMGVIAETCKKEHMGFYLLDDTHFPSGFGNGAGAGTPYQRMMLREMHVDLCGPRSGGRILVVPDGQRDIPVAVVAGRKLKTGNRTESFVDLGGFAVDSLVDLTDRIVDGMIAWDVPDGVWRVFILTASYVSERNPPQQFLNPLLPDASRLMIQTIYQPHVDFFGDACGKTFLGFFSDEPALRAGRGSHALPGEYPQLPIPWRLDMPELLARSFGPDARKWLPGLWYEAGVRTHEIRYALMDTVSALYAENYSRPLGKFCDDHGLAYIGHVIEQNGAHARLGQGAGHYYRAVSGQTMSGMDLVLHELKPAFRDHYHAWHTQDFEAEDAFFRYMLPQMTVSAACIDPRKQGRALCEIFGAYGWQESVGEMRYLANLLLSRGINYFTPHAYTLRPFPDPDSPPHFGKANPLDPFIHRLFEEMETVASLIDGGTPLADIAVLYHAELEWLNGSSCMKSQDIVKVLCQNQLPCLVLPIDGLDAWPWKTLLIPEADAMPAKLLEAIECFRAQGRDVYVVHRAPQADQNGLWVGSLPEHFQEKDVSTDVPQPCLNVYPCRTREGTVVLLFNEHDTEPIDVMCTLKGPEDPVLFCPEDRTCMDPEAVRLPGASRFRLRLGPGQLLIAGTHRSSWPAVQKTACFDPPVTLQPEWTMALPDGQVLTSACPPDPLSLNPRLSGTVTYTAVVSTEGFDRLEIPGLSGSVQVFADDMCLGTRDSAPYRFDGHVPAGNVLVRVETTLPLVYRFRDALSRFDYLPGYRMQGPLRILKRRSL